MENRFYFTDDEWQKINSALNVAISLSLMHAKDMHQQILDAGNLMDDIANRDDDGED